MDAATPPSSPGWRLGPNRWLDLARPRVIAVLNITPDSFSDGGFFLKPEAALARAEAAVAQGADVLDIGGESTRPGAMRIGAPEQIARILPVIRAVRSSPGPLGSIPISVDTTLAPVAKAALEEGADAVNDVSAAREDPLIFGVVARHRAGLILMHRLSPPDRDSYSDRYTAPPVYADVTAEVKLFLSDRMETAMAAGVPPESIVLDPGLGFGKTVEQNLELLRRTGDLAAIGRPVLSALSRKSFVARAAGLPDAPPAERLTATLACSVMHYAAGARLFRVHDVAEHIAALRAAHAISMGSLGGGI